MCGCCEASQPNDVERPGRSGLVRRVSAFMLHAACLPVAVARHFTSARTEEILCRPREFRACQQGASAH